ncbi:hypothetical protein [Streptomyces katrae]|uniref:hypothetical protein n=1 Tax=Streptomyces katrae TaxID=68223 RepID=UPI0004C0247E|nr:hypothetical protein [Streptomyces katrae]
MATERNIRTNFAFYPPEGDEGAWGAGLEDLEGALRQAFPDTVVEYRVSGVHDVAVLDFEIELAPGVWIDGKAAMPKPDSAFITLTNVTADEAAVFARWLRDSFVPPPRLLRFASSLAMASGEQDPWPLPADGGDQETVTELRRHLASLDGTQHAPGRQTPHERAAPLTAWPTQLPGRTPWGQAPGCFGRWLEWPVSTATEAAT